MKKLFTIIFCLGIFGFSGAQSSMHQNSIAVSQVQESFTVLITATWCVACGTWGEPEFEDALSGRDGIDVSRLNALNAHYSFSDNLYCSIANTFKNFYSVGVIPAFTEGVTNYGLESWTCRDAINSTQAGFSPSCAVGVKTTIAGNTMTINTLTRFYSTVTGDVRVAVYITEDDVIEPQQIDDSTQDMNFIHNRVLRGAATSTWGAQILNGTAYAGEEHYQEFYFDVSSYDTTNLHAVAVIYKISGSTPEAVLNSHSDDGFEEPTSVESVKAGIPEINLYPNPSDGSFYLKMLTNETKDIDIQVFDINGKIIYQSVEEQVSGACYKKMDLSNFSAGIYHIRFVTDNGVVNKKLLIQ